MTEDPADHCVHCGDNCGDDTRGPATLAPVIHTDERGAYWRPGCCPRCRLLAELTGLVADERATFVAAMVNSTTVPASIVGHIDALEWMSDRLGES